MKLLGVEFVGLGLLEKQYVPLGRGVTLLAGRNNAGKSALLNALFALKGLPEGASAGILTEYSDGDVEINLYCRSEENDGIDAVYTDGWWKEIVTKFSPMIIYRFKAARNFGSVGFLGAD